MAAWWRSALGIEECYPITIEGSSRLAMKKMSRLENDDLVRHKYVVDGVNNHREL